MGARAAFLCCGEVDVFASDVPSMGNKADPGARGLRGWVAGAGSPELFEGTITEIRTWSKGYLWHVLYDDDDEEDLEYEEVGV